MKSHYKYIFINLWNCMNVKSGAGFQFIFEKKSKMDLYLFNVPSLWRDVNDFLSKKLTLFVSGKLNKKGKIDS